MKKKHKLTHENEKKMKIRQCIFYRLQTSADENLTN